MKNSSKNPIQKNHGVRNSNLFLQLGIILALVFVYAAFEVKITKTVNELSEPMDLSLESELYIIPSFEIEKPKNQKLKEESIQPKLLTEVLIDEGEDMNNEPEDFVIEPETQVNIDSLFGKLPKIDEPEDESIPFIVVEQAPRFPGCKGKSEEEFKQCFSDKIRRFVANKLNKDINISLNGKQRILVFFEINKFGDVVNIQAKAAHERLQKEAIKTVSQLPKMEPGKQRGNEVGVKYTLPIAIYLD